MSVANSSLAIPSRNSLFTVRLAPYLVETLCELTRAVRDKTHAQTEVSGLLFGIVEDGMTTVEALKTFKDSGPRSELARRERMDKAFAAALTQAQEDSEFSPFRLIGWFSLRNGSGLMNRDIEFHNTHFKGEDDVALVLWREAETQIIAELYANKAGSKLTSDDYRWSSVRLSTELRRVSEPLDLAMRLKTSDDLYVKSYATPDAEERKDEWKKLAASAKRTMLWFLPGRGKPDEYTLGAETESQRDAATDEPRKPTFEAKTLFVDTSKFGAAAPVATPAPPPVSSAAAPPAREFRRVRERAAEEPVEVSGLPMVIDTKKKNVKQGVPWLSMALVFVLFVGVTFGLLAWRGLSSGTGTLAQVMRVIFPGDDLGLRVESQGERLLLSWNRRNPVVLSAASAILHIHDAGQDRDIKLDSSQVAEGAVLYRPVSGDVTFRLDVTGADQTTTTGSMRVLDANNPAANGHDRPVMEVGGMAPGATNANAPLNPIAAGPVSKLTNGSPSQAVRPVAGKGTAAAAVPVSGSPDQESLAPATPPTSAVQSSQTKAADQEAPPTSAPETNTPAAAPKQNPPTRVEPHTTAPPAGGTAINPWQPGDSSELALPAPPPPEQPVPVPLAETPADAKTLAFVGPKVLLQVLPNTRSLSQGVVSHVTRVEVEVTIDQAGHVKAAHVVNPEVVKSALAGAAVSAAKQWTFQPATLRGEKVESDHTIVFEFRPENQ